MSLLRSRRSLSGLIAVAVLFLSAAPVAHAQKIYWAQAGSGAPIHSASLDGTNIQTLLTNRDSVRSLTIDPVRGKLYWAEFPAFYRADLDGSNVELIIDTFRPGHIVIDPWNAQAYYVDWTDVGPSELRRVNLDLTDDQLLVSINNGVDLISSAALRLALGTLFWTRYELGSSPAGSGRIHASSLDGIAASDLVITVRPRGLIIDHVHGKLYWSSAGYDQSTTADDSILRANLDGSNVEQLLAVSTFAIVIDPVDEKLYWTEREAGRIMHSNLDGSDAQVFLSGLVFPDALALYRPTDCNANGIEDWCDISCGETGGSCDLPGCGTGSDTDFDGVLDQCEDCNSNGIPDPCDLSCGVSGGACDLAGCGGETDCDLNGIPDGCESADCNSNSQADRCDILSGNSQDCNDNAVPDECEAVSSDCNNNQVPDDCDLAAGSSPDCNTNSSPDECDLADNDCNSNGVPDECESDCNENAVADACDISGGTSEDCESNGIPDECEINVDCNGNSLRDVCDIADGTSQDANGDGIPDECCPPPCEPLLPNSFGTCSGSGNAVCDVNSNNCSAGQGTCEPCGQVRYLSFQISRNLGVSSAIRIRLASLHDPVPPPPGAMPSFELIEGKLRYLNTIPGAVSRCCNPASNPLTCNTSGSCNSDIDCAGLGANTKCEKHLCPDSTAYGTYFRCGLIGCTPEYRDWSDFSGLVTYATGSTVVPSSLYGLSQLDAACAGDEADCPAASPELMVFTERWGNVDCTNTNGGVPGAGDVGRVVDKVKETLGAYIKPRTHVAAAQLDPLSGMGAQHIGRVVDAIKGQQYPFNINCTSSCSTDGQCGVACVMGHCYCATDSDCAYPETCSENDFCTTVKDPCTGLCQP